jgi:hypothetical protein
MRQKKSDNIAANYAKLVKEIQSLAIDSITQFEKSITPERELATPEDTGDLLKSYKFALDTSKLPQNMIEYTMSYGPVIDPGTGIDYAQAVHEWPITKNWTKPGSGPKFLERPVYSHIKELVPLLIKNFNTQVKI